MNIIFLDIDGVLNSINYLNEKREEWKKTGYWGPNISSNRVKILKEIVLETDAKIVLTSTYRFGFSSNMQPLNDNALNLFSMLKKYDLTLYDMTKVFINDDPYDRVKEIRTWLEEHQDVSNFVILDCEDDMGEFTSNLVRTNYYTDGLTEELKDKSIKILKGEKVLKLK